MASTASNKFVIESWGEESAARILTALAAIEDDDMDYLLTRLDDGGKGKFWQRVIADLRTGLNVAI